MGEEHTHRMWLVLILGFCLLSASTGQPASRKEASDHDEDGEPSVDEEKTEEKEGEDGGEGDEGDKGEDKKEKDPEEIEEEEEEGSVDANKEFNNDPDIKFKVDITNKEEAGTIVEHVIKSLKSLNSWLQELVQYWDRIVESKSGIGDSESDMQKGGEEEEELSKHIKDKASEHEEGDEDGFDIEKDSNTKEEGEKEEEKEGKEDEAERR